MPSQAKMRYSSIDEVCKMLKADRYGHICTFSHVYATAADSPASSYSSTSSLFASGGATPRLPAPWMQAKDPEGRHFFLNPLTGESQWDIPTA